VNDLFETLQGRGLISTKTQYAKWMGSRSRSYTTDSRIKPSLKALVSLHKRLVEAGQFDLAAVVQARIFGIDLPLPK
jgi:hypothetical protein